MPESVEERDVAWYCGTCGKEAEERAPARHVVCFGCMCGGDYRSKDKEADALAQDLWRRYSAFEGVRERAREIQVRAYKLQQKAKEGREAVGLTAWG